jgi:hypothetical protein
MATNNPWNRKDNAMLAEGTSNNATDSKPTTVALDSKMITVTSDTTDERGTRHVVLQTTATGNNREGYKAAEREAHSWFFANYNPIFPEANTKTRTHLTPITTDLGLSSGRITEEWLASSHPVIKKPKGVFMFGHHTGLNPTATEPTWGFQFEVLPMGGVELN